MGVLNELIGAVSWDFSLYRSETWRSICFVVVEYGDIPTGGEEDDVDLDDICADLRM